MAIDDGQTERQENLIDRLKSINALFLQQDRGVIERYAGIAELALYKDVQKVGVLTLGLLDSNPQVRTLAAGVLTRSYGMRETSDAVLKLLENEGESLQAFLRNHEQDDFHVLLRAIEKLLAKPRILTIEGRVIDYDRRHVLAILEGLGRRLREHPEARNQQISQHPLKGLLEEKENRWILPRIFAALNKSQDVYCRRTAIRVIGEFDLECERETPNGVDLLAAFDLICEAIEREENRDDYLVTRDGIKALLLLTQQAASPEYRARFTHLLSEFFHGRNYAGLDFETAQQQSYLTRFHCMEMVQELADFALCKQLLADGEKQGFLSMTRVGGSLRGVPLTGKVRKALYLLKRGVFQALQQIYRQESQTAGETMSAQQQEILDLVTTWISSQDRTVPGMAITFFQQLPNSQHALRSVLESARANDAAIALHLGSSQGEGNSQGVPSLRELLEERKECIVALGTLLAQAGVSQAGLQVLRLWCVQDIPLHSEQVRKAANGARLEALWTLYDLTRDATGEDRAEQPGLQEIVPLLKAESDSALRVVLELLHASASEEPLAHLNRIAANEQEDRLVCVCAEIESIIRTRGLRQDLSEEAARFIAGKLGTSDGIHLRLATRFLPVLSQMSGPHATALLGALLQNTRLMASLQALLQEHLSDAQSHQHYELLQQTLWRTMKKRYPDRQQLRLSYLNLLRAGRYQQALQQEGQAESDERYISNERFTPLQKQLVQAFVDINTQFEDVLSPVLVSEGTEQVISLDSSTPTDLHTVLYMAGDLRDHRPAIRSYLRTHSFPAQTRVFLHRALSDTEIAQRIYRSLAQKTTLDGAGYEIATGLPGSIVGRIETVSEEGAFVDIGLRTLRPFVRKEHLCPPDSAIEDWQDYAPTLSDALLSFTIQRIAFQNSPVGLSICEIGLRRTATSHDIDDELVQSAAGGAVQARVLAVDSEHARVILRANGRNIAVALEDLSWNTSAEWMERGWQRYFRQRSGQTCAVVFRAGVWSLKACQPYAEYFSQLIYYKGLSPFSLVYVTQEEAGHIFEIEPGQFCSVPAERLLDQRAQALAQDVQPVFLLPSRTLGCGDILQVCFKEEPVEGQAELVLHVGKIDEDQCTNDRLRPGMKKTGKLVDLEPATGRGRLIDVAGLEEGYTVVITHLPIDDSLEEGCDVSGRIVQVSAKQHRIVMEYALALPDDLQENEFYPCRVSHTPAPGDYRLQVQYANIQGELREAEMTYGHTSVLARYRKGDVVVARLVQKRRERRFARVIRPRQYEKLVAAAGLEQPGVCTGDIIRCQRELLTVEQEDGSVYELALNDLDLKADEVRSLRPGNRLQLRRDQQGQLHLSLETSYAIFSLLPRLEKKSEWTRYDQLAAEALARLFPEGQPRECLYVTTTGSMLLLELQPGLLLALPFSALTQRDPVQLQSAEECYQLTLQRQKDQLYFQTPQSRFVHALAPGDTLTLLRPEGQNVLHFTQLHPGPLHLAAEPWLAELPTEGKLALSAVVIPTRTTYEHGVLVEIKRISELPVRLRNGLTSLYISPKMAPLDRQLFAENRLLPGQEVQVVLEYPPELRDGRLRLAIKGLANGATLQEALPVRGQLLDPLPYLRELQAGQTVTGSLLSYDKEEGAFLVSLDDLKHADQERYDCWLDQDLVSFSQVSSFLTMDSLKAAGVQTFTVMSCRIDEECAVVEVSLRDNPLLDIDLAGDFYAWTDGQLLKHATYIGPLPAPPAQGDLEEVETPSQVQADDEQMQAPRAGFALEIVPGLLVSVAATALSIDGLPCQRRKHLPLQPGDQVLLRVLYDNDHYGFDVVSWQQAEINLLSNRRRVVYGRVGARDGENLTLKLEGYHRTRCLIDPQVLPELDMEKLAGVDLFRFTRCNQERTLLYFRPLHVSQLEPDDLLYVHYQPPTDEQSDRAIVLFGNQQAGYIRQREISYQVGFHLQSFAPPAERSTFEARIVSVQPDSHVVFFSLKGLAVRQLDYFLEHRSDQRFSGIFAATLVALPARNDALDVELEPGIIVRLPLSRVSVDPLIGLTAYDLKDRLLPGDVLQLRLLVKAASTVSLSLTGIRKSLLHYLHQGMLVHASLLEKQYGSGAQWIFTLPEYGNRRGVLASSGQLDFFPDVFYENLQFVVQHIPADPGASVRLRQRTDRDEQQVVRIEAVDVDAIRVCKEDGHKADIYIRYATYRVDDRISYLARTLQTARVLTATRTTGQRGETILSLLANPPAPFAFLPGYLQRRQLEALELTYVRSEGPEHIFELEPGYCILIPASALFFYDCPMPDLQRFLPGDVFTASVQRAAHAVAGELSVSVRSLHLSVLHHWQPEQYLCARVIETYPRSGGIVVKAGPLETFLAEKGGLLPQHTANTFAKHDTLWVKIAQINPNTGTIRLVETLPPSRERLQEALKERKRPLLAAKIRPPQAHARSLELEVLGETLSIQPRDLIWSEATTVREVLLPGEKELWVRLFLTGERLRADARSFLVPHVSRYLKAGARVQAYVEKVNDQPGELPGKVLVNVDGVRTLVSGEDLVCGLPPTRVGVKEGIWLTVCVLPSEQSQFQTNGAAAPRLSVSGRALGGELEKLSPGSSFQARVRYTLAHGLVFTYQGTPGYIANQDLAWNEEASAAELFEEGDALVVFLVSARTSASPCAFSLKHRSQIEGLKCEETINATVYRVAEKNIYLQTADLPTNFFVQFSERQPDFALLSALKVGDPVLIRLGEQASVSRLLTPFQVHHNSAESTLQIDLPEAETRQPLAHVQENAATRFVSLLSDSGLLEQIRQPLTSAQSETLLTDLLGILTNCAIPCTCRNLRILLKELDQSAALQGFWQVLAAHRLDEDDGPMVTVLCRVAQGLTGVESRSNPPRALLAQIAYAQGITVLVSETAERASYEQALESLLSAYQHSPHVEIMLALVLVYGKLQAFERVQEFLDLLVAHFCRNLHLLFPLPEPPDIHSATYPRLRTMVPGLNMSLDAFATEMQRTVRDNLAQGKVGAAISYLNTAITRLRAREIEMPELYLNLALCSLSGGHFAHAQSCLDEVRRVLEKGEEKKRFFHLHLPYAQLTIFLAYQQKKFARIQRFLIEEVEQGFDLWEQTCFPAYLLLAAGYRAASRACSEAVPVRRDSQPERILLSLYWRRDPQLYEKELQRLHEVLFGRFYKSAGNWEQGSTGVQILPELPPLSRFKEVVRLCYDYDVPLYALTKYREVPALEQHIGDPAVATQLVDLALRSARVEEAQAIALDHFAKRETASPMDAARFMSRFYVRLLQGTELQKFSLARPRPAWNEIFKQALAELAHPGDLASAENSRLMSEEYAINRILEHWLKSPGQTRRPGMLLAQLLRKSPQLSTHYWRSPVLRQRLWHVFAASHDYGTLLEILPKPDALSLDMLEDITLHLYLLRLHPRAFRLIQDVQSRLDLAQDEQSALYLGLLQKLGEQECGPTLDRTLTCLLQRPSRRQLAFFLESEQRQVAIEALTLLVHAPAGQDLVNMRCVLAELLELEGQYAQAVQVYQALLCAQEQLSPVRYVCVALHLLRLSACERIICLPVELLDRQQFQAQEPLYDQLLQDLLTLFQHLSTAQQRTDFVLLLGRVQIALAQREREEGQPVVRTLFLAQLEALLSVLFRLPRPQRCFVTLYRVLIGTEPLKDWQVEDLSQLCLLFFDAGLFLNFDSDLEKTMRVTIAHRATLAQTGSRQDQEHAARLEAAVEDVARIDFWQAPRWLKEHPDQLAQTARIVRMFLQRGERFSQALLDEATQALREEPGLDLSADADSRWLVTQALLAQGEVTQALQQSYSERDLDMRDELLLDIFFAQLKAHDFQGIRAFLPHLSVQTLKHVERLLAIWEKPDARCGANVQQDLAYLVKHGQRQLAVHYLYMQPDASLSHVKDRELAVLIAYLCSHRTPQDDPALRRVLTTTIAARKRSGGEPWLTDWLLAELAGVVLSGA